jgi:ornithine carbamoyltransferase
MVGVEVALATPPGHGLDEVTLDAVVALGGTVREAPSPADAVVGAEAVCTDVWVSMGQEAESLERLDAFAAYQVDAPLMARAGPGAVFLHCLPAHRGEEVTAEVIDGPASLVWPQAGNRLRAMRGVLSWMFGA